MAQVYLLTSPSSKNYVGITNRDVQCRFAEHCKDARSDYDSPLCRAIRKHGLDKFDLQVLFEGEWEEVVEREDEFIKLHRSDDSRFGYNARSGGIGGRQSDDGRRRISEAMAERMNRPEEKTRNSNAMKAAWNDPEKRDRIIKGQRAGKPRSQESERRRLRNSKNTTTSPEYRKAQSERMKMWWAARKKEIDPFQ